MPMKIKMMMTMIKPVSLEIVLTDSRREVMSVELAAKGMGAGTLVGGLGGGAIV